MQQFKWAWIAVAVGVVSGRPARSVAVAVGGRLLADRPSSHAGQVCRSGWRGSSRCKDQTRKTLDGGRATQRRGGDRQREQHQTAQGDLTSFKGPVVDLTCVEEVSECSARRSSGAAG